MVKRKREMIDLTVDEEDCTGPISSSETSKSTASIRGQDQLKSQKKQFAETKTSSSEPHSNILGYNRDERSSSSQDSVSAHDMNREIDLTQDDGAGADADIYENYQLYGILQTKIVGCRFYDGRATIGEYTLIRREPSNPYDQNAIRIDNVMRQQIGHIGRNVAAKLAPLLDTGEIKIEGELNGPKTFYDCPIALKLFGTSVPRPMWALKAKMQQLKLPVSELNKSERERQKRAKEMEKQQKAREKLAARMRENGASVFDAEGPNKYSNLGGLDTINNDNPSLEQLLSTTSTYNPRQIQDLVNTFGVGEEALSKLSMVEQPTCMATVLIPYQRQGVQWMLDHESPKLPKMGSREIVQLWKNTGGLFSNIATSFTVSKAPELASGGILADDMGLGKTIQVLSLIMLDPARSKGPTLIVSPLSVMSNWRDQAIKHIKEEFSPKVLIYHGQQNRGLTSEALQDYHIILTTYQTLTAELFPNGQDKPVSVPTSKGLFSLQWRRVVLDEGHQIRNPKAKMTRAACALSAQSRWVLSGTPIVNSLKDLYSHVKFIRLSGGLDDYEIFHGTLIRPLKLGNPEAKALLQVLMSTLCLRRMKDMKFIDLRLPGISFHKYEIKFLPHEKERYDAFKSEALGLVEEAKAKKGQNTMTHLLEVLLRLRQTCNHWKMCGEDRVKRLLSLVEGNKAVDTMNAANRKALQDLLQLKIDSQDECPICMETISSPMITACGHAFCSHCITRVIQMQQKCPMCRAELKDVATGLVEPAANFGEGDDEEIPNIDADTSSSKIEALVTILKASSEETDTKVVVFSQWTSFLDLIQIQFEKNNLKFVRLDGKMTVAQRDSSVETLNTDPEIRILLASLSVCSVGLNLTAANTVILADSWWAPAIEDQAVDRVYRLGQTRECKVIRLVIEGTIEDEVLAIQDRKRKLAAEAFGEGSDRKRHENRTGTLRDIESLLR